MQGPRALDRLGLPPADAFTWAMTEVDGVEVMACYTGYTGERGCELLCMAEDAGALWDAVIERGAVPCGLGARDSLRLEVCYPLHGNDITPETDAISAGLGWACALEKDFTGAEELRRVKAGGPARRLAAFVMDERAVPRQGMAILEGGEVTSGTHSPMLEIGIGLGYVDAELAAARDDAHGRRPREAARGARREEADLHPRGALMLEDVERYPADLKYHPEHDWARIEGGEATLGVTWFAQDALGELVHYEAPEPGATVTKDQSVRRGRVGQGRLRRDRAAVGDDRRGQPDRDRRAGAGQRGPVRRGLARPHPGRRPLRGGLPAGLGGLRGARGEPVSFLSVTARDRDEMLAAIGVASVEELFADIPESVRLGRALDLEPALSEPELVAHLEHLAGRNVDSGRELSFLGAGIYDHYVPAVVDAVLQRGELLTAYTPYQPEMSQGMLQAIFEYQTAICELTGMDVSNASGYDGTTVAADACYVAKHATGRSLVVVTEATNPQVRQVVKTYAPGFGLEVVEVPHRDGATDPDELRPAAEDAACVIFQQPNFFGVLEPAPDLAAAAADAGALAVAHVDPVSLGLLEAPGNYGCAMAIGEGQGAGNYQSYGGPHYGFLAAKAEFTRRMPGRIIGETTDVDGRRGYVLTLQTREQHIRREKATSNITTNQTLLALAGLVHLSWLGPQGLREVGETCLALAEYARERLRDAGFEPAFPSRQAFKELAVRVGRPAKEAVRAARERGVHPGYALGRDYAGLDDALLVALTEKRTAADVDRLAEVLAEVAA